MKRNGFFGVGELVRLFILLTFVLSVSGCGEGMTFGSKSEVYLFSGVKGLLTYKGEIVRHVRLRRWLEYNGEQYEDHTETRSDGFFVFDSIRKNERSILPKEFISHQKIFVTHQGGEVLIWETVKRSEEENAELEGRVLNFTCELTEEPRFVHLAFNSIGTKCRWQED